jgi:hypothetical protein
VHKTRNSLKDLESQYFGIRKAANDWPDILDVETPVYSNDRRLSSLLNSPLLGESEEQRLRRLLSGRADHTMFAGLLVGEFLYDYLRIDPLVMEGIDFARAADLGNPLLFAQFANMQTKLTAAGDGDSIARLQGYVAERLVAQHMSAAGYDVSLPEHSNQAGYDLLIDGQPFQVKCTESARHIREHLEKYPDIPVIVNAEHANALAGVAGVYVDPALSVTDVTSMTEAGIADGSELLDFELPWIALAASTAVEIRDLYHSRTGITAAAVNVATNTIGRTAIGTVGAYAGSGIGSLLFGPAGSVIGSLVGAAGGGIGGGRLAKMGRAFLVSEESDAVRHAARDLAVAASQAVPDKLRAWGAKRQQISDLVLPDQENQSDVKLIKNWLLEQMKFDTRYTEQRRRELERFAAAADKPDPHEFSRQVIDLIGRAGIHPHKLQAEIGGLFSALNRLDKAVSSYRIGRPGSGGTAK